MLSEPMVWCALLGLAAGPFLRVPVDRLAPAGPGAAAAGPWSPGVRGLALGLVTSALFAVLAWRVGPGLDLVAFLVLAASGVTLALIDVRSLRLPDPVTLVVALAGLTLLGIESLALGESRPYVRALCGAATLGAYHLCLFVLNRGGLGLGDVKLAAVLGLHLCWLGWGVLVVGAAAAFVLAALAATALLLTGRVRRRTALPFGPWMLLGALVGILCGDQVATWYVGV